MYYIQKFGIDEHGIREINQRNFVLMCWKNKFYLQINPKDTEFIRYKSFLIDLKKKNI
jgi:RNA-directed DNA polymerase